MGKKKKNRPTDEAEVSEPVSDHWGVAVIRYLAMAAAFCVLLAPHGHATLIGFSKVVGFEIITAAMLAVWLSLIWTDARYRPNWRSPLVIGSTVFIAALAVTVPFSVDPYHSFWSDVYRQTGFYNYAHYWLWFLILSSTQRGRPAWQRIFGTWNIAALTVGVYGIFSALKDNVGGRLESTLGNALYLSIFCLVSIIVAAILLSWSKNWTKRAYYGGSMLFLAVILAMTGSRSSVLGLGVFILASSLALLFVNNFNWRKSRVSLAILGLFLLASVSWVTLRTDWASGFTEKLPYGMQRIVNVSGAGIDRAVLSDVAIQMFKEKPVFGWGLDMFEHGFEKHYDPTGPTGLLSEPWYDRAHNQFMDFLSMGGVVGFGGYILLWVALIVASLRKIREHEDEERVGYALALAGMIGYAVNAFYAFDLLAILPLVWGIMAYVASRDPDPNAVPPEESPYLAHVALGLAIVLVSVQMFVLLRPLFVAQGIDWSCRNFVKYPDKALERAADSLQKFTFATPESRFRVIDCFGRGIEQYNSMEWKHEAAKFIAAESDRGTKPKPYDFKTRMINSFSYSALGRFDRDALLKAQELTEQTRELQPNRHRTEMIAAQIASRLGDHAQAAQYYQKTIDLCPNQPEINRIKPLLIIELASAGQFDQALEVIRRGYEAGQPPAPNPQASQALEQALPEGFYLTEEAADWFKRTASTYPSPSSLSSLYKALTKASNASEQDLQEAKQALLSTYPDLAEQLGIGR